MQRDRTERDWVAGPRAYALAWGLPTLALVAASVLDPGARAAVWATSLLWMGAACLVNARRCGRIHCHLTGPFFIAMALATVAHATGTFTLGVDGWRWLAATLVAGTVGLWWGSERLLGRYARRDETAVRGR